VTYDATAQKAQEMQINTLLLGFGGIVSLKARILTRTRTTTQLQLDGNEVVLYARRLQRLLLISKEECTTL